MNAETVENSLWFKLHDDNLQHNPEILTIIVAGGQVLLDLDLVGNSFKIVILIVDHILNCNYNKPILLNDYFSFDYFP
jgi:hypothetical protein